MFAKLQSWQREWLFALGLLALTCVVYLPVLHAVFVWDDSFMITDNQMLRSTDGLYKIWFTNKPADHIPITLSALWLQYHLWHLNPLGYHIVNVLTHALGAILLWRILKRLAILGAWLAAAVFAIHPVGAASAAWISEQKNTISIIFFLLTILCYLRFEERPKAARYALALLMYVFALISKGSVVMLPFTLLLAAWWQRGKLTRWDLLRTIPFFLLSFGEGLTAIWFQNHRAIGGEMVQSLDRLGQLAAAGMAVWFYLWKAWMPVNIMVIYPQWQIDSHSVMPYLPGFLLCGLLVASWYYRATWGRHVLFGLGFMIVMLFPVMGFFNMYFLIFSRVADHWQYLPMLGSISQAVCGAVYGFQRLAAKYHFPKLAAPALALLLLLFLGWSTWGRAEVYTTEASLWTDTVKKNPKAWMAYNNLGNALGNQHKRDEAMAAYEKAIAVNPDFPDAHSNLGNSLVGKKKYDEAIAHFRKAIAVQPKMANFHFNLGIALFEKGKSQEAINEYLEALRLNPGAADVRNNLSNVYNKEGKYQEALEQALIAIQIKPQSPEPHINAAMALSSLGRTAEAAKYFDEAIRLNPDVYLVHHEYGIMLAMQGKLNEALPHFLELVRLKPDDAASFSNLGNTYAGLKRLDDALNAYHTALRLQPDDGQTHNNLANVLMEQGKLDEALEHYKISLKNRPDDTETRLNYSIALARKGDRAEAIKQCQEALRQNPNSQSIRQHLQTLTNGQ